jgi:two-component system sensor histidine kinase MprB
MALHYRRSLASRVTLLATIAVGVSVAAMALAGYFTTRHQLFASLDHSLYQRAHSASQSAALTQLTLSKVPPWMLGAADVKVALVLANGEQRSSDSGLGAETLQLGVPELQVARGQREWSVRNVATETNRYRVAAVPGNTPGTALVLAQSLRPTDEALDQLGLVLLVFGAAGVITAAMAGWGVARNGLRPVRRLTDAAEEIARTEKLEPIEVEGNDEIARLARAFNAMLAALAASRDRQRQLVADAGHELRTPLTSLRTNLALLGQADARGGLSPEARAELMDDVRFQIEELTTLIGDLTELAREDGPQAHEELVDLAEVVQRAVERVRRRAPNLDFDVRAEPWWVTGEPSALERAATNLLDNAAKWSPPLGTVTVRLTQGTLVVDDQGRGIAEEDLPHVFDRFYRSPEARTMPGSGLGLAIVRQVAERHGGSVRAGRSRDGGASFSMHVPGSAVPAEERAAQHV